MSVVPSEEQQAVLKNDFFETGLYTVETNAKSGTYKVQATGAPAGVKFVNEKGEAKTEFNVGEKFRILIPKQTPAGGFSFKVIGKLTKLQEFLIKGHRRFKMQSYYLSEVRKNKSGVIGELEKTHSHDHNNKPYTPNEPHKPNQYKDKKKHWRVPMLLYFASPVLTIG